MLQKSRHIFRHESGQNLVEFALVLPILMLIILGIVEFSWAWLQTNTATSAAREAARVAAVTTSPYSTAAAEARARTVLQNAGIDSGAATVTISAPDAATQQITVTVQFQYHSITGFIPGLNGITLQGTTSIRWEG